MDKFGSVRTVIVQFLADVMNVGAFEAGTSWSQTVWRWGQWDSSQFWPVAAVVVEFLVDVGNVSSFKSGTSWSQSVWRRGQWNSSQFWLVGSVIVQSFRVIVSVLAFGGVDRTRYHQVGVRRGHVSQWYTNTSVGEGDSAQDDNGLKRNDLLLNKITSMMCHSLTIEDKPNIRCANVTTALLNLYNS